MQRLSLNQQTVDTLRADAQASYPGKSTPLPGSNLKSDDDVWWLDAVGARVLWGYDTDQFFSAYCPDWFGDYLVVLEAGPGGQYIADRAPADPQEPPLPIYPEPQQQQQRQAPKKPAAKTPTPEQLRALIKLQPTKEARKAMREAFKKRGLLKGDDKADRDDD